MVVSNTNLHFKLLGPLSHFLNIAYTHMNLWTRHKAQKLYLHPKP